MDISKIGDSAKVELSRKYFLIGLCFLPLVWLTNVVWFFSDAFCRPPYPARGSLRKYVLLSALGFAVWAVIIICWEIIFQMYRSEGIAWSDYLTFVFPVGRV